MNQLRITCQICHQPLGFSFDYPDSIQIKPCECTTGEGQIVELKEELSESETMITGLNSTIAELRDETIGQQVEICDLEVEVARLKKHIEENVW